MADSCDFEIKDKMREKLDLILADWYQWAKGYKHVGGINSSPIFRSAKSSRGWDSTSDICAQEVDSATMEAVDFNVSEMEPIPRTAIGIHARNLATGYAVWSSARLPTDPVQRTEILIAAKVDLIQRLTVAGVL